MLDLGGRWIDLKQSSDRTKLADLVS